MTLARLVGGGWAIAGLTAREVLRQRLWLLPLAAAVAILVAVPTLPAVTPADRQTLAVVLVGSVCGFVLTLGAVLVAGHLVRRDLESRTGFLLFAKPLPRLGYVLGRWCGLVGVLAIALLLMGGVGCAAVAWRLGGLPTPRQTQAPVQAWKLERGGAVELPVEQETIFLRGSPRRGEGQGVRLRWTGLPVDEGQNLLLQARVGGRGPISTGERARVQVSARLADGGAVRLELDPDSPMGGSREGEIDLVHRDARRRHLDQDYARLVLPVAVLADGVLDLQIDRLDETTTLAFSRDGGALVASRGGSFLANAVLAGAVQLAQAAVLAAAALLLVVVANEAVALLGGLTLFFGGHAVAALRAGISTRDGPTPASRFLDLYGLVQPDFARYGVEAQLAAGERIAFGTVGAAWGYFGIFIVVYLGAAWLLLRRREL